MKSLDDRLAEEAKVGKIRSFTLDSTQVLGGALQVRVGVRKIEPASGVVRKTSRNRATAWASSGRAWICCRAIFIVERRRQYLELYVQAWPKRYDRDAFEEVRRFAAEVAEEHGIEVSLA